MSEVYELYYWPGIPGHSSMGKNAQSVVAVEAVIGQNIRLAAAA